MASLMHRQLIPPNPYEPLPTSTESYVPVLQDHLGERTALSHASSRAWSAMTPLVEVVARGGKLSDESIKSHIRALKKAVGDRPLYLDIKKLEPCTPTPTSRGDRPALELLYETARARSLKFMPVAWTNSNEQHLSVVANTAYVDDHGLALRHRLSGISLPSGVTLTNHLEARLDTLQADVSEVDLLLDLEFLDPDAEPSAKWVAGIVAQCVRVGTWRSLVLIATSVPSSFGNGLVPEHSTRKLPRREWTLRNEVIRQVSRPVAFGDYAVQNPVPPPNPPPIGPWANIRYTLEDSMFVARGFDTRTRGTDQYAELSSWVASHPSFRGASFSHGDSEITSWSALSQQHTSLTSFMDFNNDLEEGSDEVTWRASPTYWRGVGTSHHLELVTEQLRQS
jgi:hypothetical protein